MSKRSRSQRKSKEEEDSDDTYSDEENGYDEVTRSFLKILSLFPI